MDSLSLKQQQEIGCDISKIEVLIEDGSSKPTSDNKEGGDRIDSQFLNFKQKALLEIDKSRDDNFDEIIQLK